MAMLTCNQTGALSIVFTLAVAIFIAVACAIDSWEIITYDKDKLEPILTTHGYNLTVEKDYYIITLNNTVSIHGVHVPESYALILSVNGGLWKSCSILSDETIKKVADSKTLRWAADDQCITHPPTGSPMYKYDTGPFIRQMMTRTGQACLMVSIICLLITFGLGLTSLIINHVILSTVAAVLCYTSGLYQLFCCMLLVRRHAEAKEYLEPAAIPIDLADAITVTYGTSAYIAITGFVVAIICGTMWIIHTKTLRGAIKLYIPEDKYNLWCRN